MQCLWTEYCAIVKYGTPHVKTQNELLYLETGVLNIERIISNHRMMFFQTLLKRDDNEITKKVYISQKNNSVKGDWLELSAKDFKDIDMPMNEDIIMNKTKAQFKSRIKKKTWKAYACRIETKTGRAR